jgi:DNA-binding transcriptional LysR family regulator
MNVLADSTQRLVASPGILEGLARPLVPADLSSLPSLAWGPPQRDYAWRIDGPDGASAMIPHEPRFITEDMSALRLAALRGVGAVQLPTMVIGADLTAGTLVDVLPNWAPRTGIVHAVFPSRRGLLPSVRAFLDFLAAEYAALSRLEQAERPVSRAKEDG